MAVCFTKRMIMNGARGRGLPYAQVAAAFEGSELTDTGVPTLCQGLQLGK